MRAHAHTEADPPVPDGTELRRLAAAGAKASRFRGCSKKRCTASRAAPSRCTAPAGPTPASTRSGRWRASRDATDRQRRDAARALNARPAADVRVLAVEEAPPSFTRASARSARPTNTASSTRRSFAVHAPVRLARPGRSTSTAMRRGAAGASSAATTSPRFSRPAATCTPPSARSCPGVDQSGQTAAATVSPLVIRIDRGRLPAPHGPQHRRHARRRRARPLAGAPGGRDPRVPGSHARRPRRAARPVPGSRDYGPDARSAVDY